MPSSPADIIGFNGSHVDISILKLIRISFTFIISDFFHVQHTQKKKATLINKSTLITVVYLNGNVRVL